MPSQLVHIAYARAYLKQHPQVDEAAFMRGTVFPDIRRLADLERHVTHHYGLSLKDVEQEMDPWQAGLMLHGYLDETWNRYFWNLGLHIDVRMPPKVWSAVKIAQESPFWGTIAGREEIAHMLEGEPHAGELVHGIALDKLEQWYNFIAWKLRQPFSYEAWRTHARMNGFDEAKMDRILERVDGILRDPEWLARFEGLEAYLGITRGA
jgi:hypothetical protein